MRRYVAVVLAALSIAMVAAPASAFTDVGTDGNDSRSPLDISRVVRTDNGPKMRFGITTWGRFKASSLDIDKLRYLWIGFDRDRRQGDATRFEYCVFVFFDRRLRWVATNCGNQFVARGLASKPSARKVVVPISMVSLDIYLRTHEWAVLSSWKGTPCSARCVDAVPNRLPLFLRDYTPPKIVFAAPPRLVTTGSTSSTFPVTFGVTDPRGSGIAEWELHSMHVGFGDWTIPATGTTAGNQSVQFVGTEGGTYDFYVTATDRQDNFAEGPIRRVIVPYDDDTVPGRVVTGTVTTVPDATAYGGTLSVLADTSSSYSFFAGNPQECPSIWLIGPGSGDWTIRITWNGNEVIVSESEIADGPREVLWTTTSCGFGFKVELVSGTSVAIDAIGDAVE
jgi:hypothetical protein